MPLSSRMTHPFERWMNNLVKREMESWRRASGGVKPSKSAMNKPSTSMARMATDAPYLGGNMAPWRTGARWPAPLSDLPGTTPSWWSPAWSNAMNTELSAPFTAEMEELMSKKANASPALWGDASMGSLMNFEWPAQLTQTMVNENGDLVMKTKLPAGVEQDDIHLDFEEGGLRLTATKSHEETRTAPTNNGAQTKHSSYVSVGHYWPLDHGVTEKDVEANFNRDEGTLEIIVNLPQKMDAATFAKPKVTPIAIGGASTPHRSIGSSQPHHQQHHSQTQQHHSHHHAEQLAADHHAKTAKDESHKASIDLASPTSSTTATTTTTTTANTTKTQASTNHAVGTSVGSADRLQTATGDMVKPTSNLVNSMNAASAREKPRSSTKTPEMAQKTTERVNVNASKPTMPSATPSGNTKATIGPDAPQVPSLDEM